MNQMTHRISSSFRDPSGFLYLKDNVLFRQVNQIYSADYDLLMTSGLYDSLIKDDLLVRHDEVSTSLALTPNAYKIIQPEQIPFISYPYEWCFGQLRDCALLTCLVQKRALQFGMILKDANSYNVQFLRGKPIFIDTLSFTKYKLGSPWLAYRQFCQHFLAPLALMSYSDVRLGQLLRIYIDGVPIELAAKLLPWYCRLNLGITLNVYLQLANAKRSKAQKYDSIVQSSESFSKQGVARLIENLKQTIEGLTWSPRKTAWANYYSEQDSYSVKGFESKKIIVLDFLNQLEPKIIWDLGANTGEYSKIASAHCPNSLVVSWDSDPGCVEVLYQQSLSQKQQWLLPLLVDLTNPSPGLGWENKERMSFMERSKADVVMALALMHHLIVGNNQSMEQVVSFFAKVCTWLIIEFVPEDDKQAQRLNVTGSRMFENYTKELFELSFQKVFAIHRCIQIEDSSRYIYLMKRHDEVVL